MSVRLASDAVLERWASTLADATRRAVERMRVAVARELSTRGLTLAEPANAAPAALWHEAEWIRAVNAEIRPAAEKVAGEILVAVRAALPAKDLWGMRDPTAQLVGLVVDGALKAGPTLAARVGTRHLPAVRAAGANLSTLGDVLDGAADQLAEINSRAASQMQAGAQTFAAEALDANADEIVMQEWATMGDDRVRDAHDAMEGQTRAAGDPFEDGDGNLLMYPGDPDAPDETTANCRCVLLLAGYTTFSAGPGASQEAISDAINDALDAMQEGSG